MTDTTNEPTMQPPVVSRTDEMTPEWFSTVLQAAGDSDAGRVTDVRTAPIGAGAMSRSVRAELDFDGADGPASVIVKYATEDAGSLGVAAGMGMYIREASFYRDVAPLIDAPIPRCYMAETEADGSKLTLVLEDLTATSRPGDSMTPATEAEADAAVCALARFQAATWNSAALGKLPWLADPASTYGMFDALPLGLDGFLERFSDSVTEAHRELYAAVVPHAGAWARSWTAPTVLQHGDFRTDNLMFGRMPGAPAATIIDFQTVRLGPPGVDLAYLLGTMLPTEERRARERSLVERYHEELLAAGATDHGFDTCWRGYRAGALYGVVLFVGLAAQVESTPRLDELMAQQSARYADMAIDLDAAGAAGLT